MKRKKLAKIRIWLLVITAALVLLRIGSRIFIGDWFPANTSSMAPAIIPGDKIWVNKLVFGARIYKNLDFFKEKSLQSYRIKGQRAIRKGDVVVFNAPVQESRPDSIVFKIDRVYVKRCIGLPGDTILVCSPVIRLNLLDSIINWQEYSGAIYVPKKGDTLYVNNANLNLYHTVIAYETKGTLPANYHVFLQNYYFMYGDNALQSYDSRYFGFVPEEFIIGIVTLVIYNSKVEWGQKWERLFKRIN